MSDELPKAVDRPPPETAPRCHEGARPRRWLRLVVGLVAALFVLLRAVPARAAFVPPPFVGQPVVDTAGKLTAEDRAVITARLVAIERSSHNEIVVFLVDSLAGEAIEDVAYKSFNTWQLGKKEAANGVLLVIAPTDRKVRIETGKGVGGALTDIGAHQIIRDRISPELKRDHFRLAILAGVDGIDEALRTGGVRSNETGKAPSSLQRTADILVPIAAFVLIGAFVLLLYRSGRGRPGGGGGGWGGGSAGGYYGGGYSGGDSGGGSFGGGGDSGGGSFGGGGDSGGGGASGDY